MCWMVASPEMARIVIEIEFCALGTQADVRDHHYPEQYEGIQATFISEVASLGVIRPIAPPDCLMRAFFCSCTGCYG